MKLLPFLFVGIVLLILAPTAFAFCVGCVSCGMPNPLRIGCSDDAPVGGNPGYDDCLTVGDCNSCAGWTCTGPEAIHTPQLRVLVAAVVDGQHYVRVDSALRPVVMVAVKPTLSGQRATAIERHFADD